MHRYLVTLILLLGLIQTIPAQENQTLPKELNIIATWSLGLVDNPLIQQEDRSAFQQMETAFDELVAQYQDPLLVDLGRFSTPQSVNETGYSSDTSIFFWENNFDAVIVNNSDYVHSFATKYGYKRRPPELESVYLSAIDSPIRELTPLPSFRVVNKEFAGRVALVHASSKSRISSIPDYMRLAVEVSSQETIEKLQMEQPDLTFLFSELPQSETRFQDYPNPQIYFNLSGVPMVQTQVGTAPFIEPPLANEFLLINGTFEDGAWKWNHQSIPWMNPEDHALLNKIELPVVGMSVPGQNRVAAVLDVDPNTISVEVFRNQSFPGITNRDPIYVYLMDLEGTRYRVYRTRNIPHTFWIPFDALIVMNPDNTIRQFVTNVLTLPYISASTRTAEAVQSVYNKPIEQWAFDPVYTSGIEQMSQIFFDSLKSTVLVDRALYPAE
ncbi:MAG: hypothetical protein ACFCU1_13215 [Sumerlaeia bacterium]